MTSAQKKQVISIIKRDAEIVELYCDSKGRTCVIGGLAFEAGCTKRGLRNLWGIISNYNSIVFAIEEKFGLSLERQQMLQQINDGEENKTIRRKKLIKQVKSWKTTNSNKVTQ